MNPYETVLSIVSSIPADLDYTFSNPELFTREVTLTFAKHLPKIQIVFSGRNQANLAHHLEIVIKNLIYEKYPEDKKDVEKSILLSYCIHGAYNASLSNPTVDNETIIHVLENAVKALAPLFQTVAS